MVNILLQDQYQSSEKHNLKSDDCNNLKTEMILLLEQEVVHLHPSLSLVQCLSENLTIFSHNYMNILATSEL
jgi:hypothetical protein